MKKQGMSVNKIIADLDSNHEWNGNVLQKIAEEVIRYAIPIEEVIKTNLSIKLLKELDREVKNEEIISLQINAKPRMSKSTLAIWLGLFIDTLLKKYKMKDEKTRFGMDNMARDQNEKSKRMRNPELMHDIIITDENNALEETGENATVEKAQRDVFSDVQAGRYVHGIWVCPEGTIDRNCDIKLEVRNKQKGLIHTRVYYFSKSQYYYGWVLIGIADFDVNTLIKRWLKIKPIFFKYLKHKKPEDLKIIEGAMKKDFYIEYMVKKYEKMELMNREGVQHARDLDYAEITKEIVERLKPLAKSLLIRFSVVKKNLKSRLERGFKKRGMPLSILGSSGGIERLESYLYNYRALEEINYEINKLRVSLKKGKLTLEQYNKNIAKLKLVKDELKLVIHEDEDYLNRMCKLNKKYNEHLI